MGSFLDVVSGNTTKATDVNQLVDALNGTVASAVTLLATSNTTTPLMLEFPTAPGADTSIMYGKVVGDTNSRVSLYMRSADGYGGIRGGTGPTFTSHLYAQAGGWQIDEALTVSGNINGSLTTGIPTNRNGVATSVPIYTGTNTPSSPPTGSIWIKA